MRSAPELCVRPNAFLYPHTISYTQPPGRYSIPSFLQKGLATDYEVIELHTFSTGVGLHAVSAASWFARAIHISSPSDVDAFIIMVRADIMRLPDGTKFVYKLDGRELPGMWVAYPNDYKNKGQDRPFIAPSGYQTGDGGVRFLIESPDESSITGKIRKLTSSVTGIKDSIMNIVHMDPVNAIGKFQDDTRDGQ